MDVQLCKPGTAETSLPVQLAQSLRILLVEDHINTARIMSRVIRVKGHQIDHAPDVVTAMKLLAKKEFDLLLSDLGLPDGHGWDIMRDLRRQGSKLPGIALSGYGQGSDIQNSIEAGYSAHFTKPVEIRILLAKAQEIVTRGG